MKKSPLFSRLCAVCLMVTPLFAEQSNPAPTPTPTPPVESRNVGSYTVDFPGGTLAQFLALLAKSPDGGINVIGEPEEMATPLPAFSLSNAFPGAVASALVNFLDPRGVEMKQATGVPPGMKPVYTVKKRTDQGDMIFPLQLSPYLELQSVDDIIGAIRAAWELDPRHAASALRLKYHPPTMILLVSGPTQAIAIAQQIVLNTLRRSNPDHTKNPPKPADIPKADEKK